MRAILNVFKWLAIILIVLALGLKLSGNGYLLKGIWATYLHGERSATITDLKFFDFREVPAGKEIPLPVAKNYNQMQLSEKLQNTLAETRSVAFLVVQNDSIAYEQYWDVGSDTSQTNSFSMAKSIVTMLVQIAIQEGKIKSWDQKVIDFLPELSGEFAAELTLRNLSTMTAGLTYNEHYTNPFDITARSYYGSNIQKLMLEDVPVANKPGTYEYQSGATQILGMVLMKATGQHLADYASEKLWKPLGASHAARWHLDSDKGTELAFCCFNSNARDFSRFGQMLLHQGNFKGTQILDSGFVQVATQPFVVPFYGHSFWVDDSLGTHVFYQRGILGQYIIVIPAKNLVIVRLGHEVLPKVGEHSKDFTTIVAEILNQF